MTSVRWSSWLVNAVGRAVLASVLVWSFSLSTVAAQTLSQYVAALNGAWQAFDPALSDGQGTCLLNLDLMTVNGKYSARKTHCGGVLANVDTWGIQGSQLVLVDKTGAPIVYLGGNQKRMSGRAVSGGQIIIERNGGDGYAASLNAVRKQSPCFYLGYTATCASNADLAAPTIKGPTSVKALVDLNVRSETRNDASVVGVVARGTCIAVDQCTLASDGPWCHGQFNGAEGWIKKLAIRQSRWPVVTYVNQC